jgi:uncharacterized protein
VYLAEIGTIPLLDSNGGNFFEIDDLANDVLEIYMCGKSTPDIIHQVSRKYGDEAASIAIKELEMLISKGLLFQADKFATYEPDQSTDISSICLMISNDCNLRCKYCYAEQGTFGRERLLMSRETAEKGVDFLFEYATSSLLTITFFGGEPLLNFDEIKHTVEYAQELATQCNKEVGFAITTNGTLLTKPIMDYLTKNRIALMISLDGKPEINDKMRVFTDGRGSYNVVYKNLEEILNNPISGHFSIRGTMTRENIDLVGAVKHLASIGCRDISVEPCFTLNDEFGMREKDVSTLKEEYSKLAREYIRAAKAGEYLPFFQFEYMIDQVSHVDLRMVSCGAGASYIAVSADGGLYPCHRLVGVDDYRFGDVINGINRPEVLQLFKNTYVNKKEKCTSCWARYLCGGGCRAYAINFNKNIYEPYSIDCELVRHNIKLAAYIHSDLKSGFRIATPDKGNACII